MSRPRLNRPLAKAFGERLRRLRLDRQLTQHQLAASVGIGASQIVRYENGSILPSPDTLTALATILEVSVDSLLHDVSGKKKEPPLIKNVRLLERLRRIDALPKKDQELFIELADCILARHSQQSTDQPKKSSVTKPNPVAHRP